MFSPRNNQLFTDEFKLKILSAFIKSHELSEEKIVTEVSNEILEDSKMDMTFQKFNEMIKQFLDGLTRWLKMSTLGWAQNREWQEAASLKLNKAVYPVARVCMSGLLKEENNDLVIERLKNNFLVDFL